MGEVDRCRHCGQIITSTLSIGEKTTVWFHQDGMYRCDGGNRQWKWAEIIAEPMLKQDYIKKFNKIWKQQTS